MVIRPDRIAANRLLIGGTSVLRLH
jgi:hypothetical protein